jgi:hypothetical protein
MSMFGFIRCDPVSWDVAKRTQQVAALLIFVDVFVDLVDGVLPFFIRWQGYSSFALSIRARPVGF